MITQVAPQALANAPAEVIAAYGRLTEKLRAFALALPVSTTQVAAALSAGYSPKVAEAKAASMAAKPDVRTVVDWILGQAVSRSTLTVERLLQEIEAIAFSDPRQLFEENGALKNMNTLPDSIAKTISGFEFGDKVKVSLWSKLDAVEKALKLLSAYPEKKDKAPQLTVVGVVVVPAKGNYQHPRKPAIEGEARPIKRVAPQAPKAKTFRVNSAS